MTKQALINKYAKKCDEARRKADEFRRSKFENMKNGNEVEAEWDALEHESYTKEFHLCEKFIRDLMELN